MVAVTVRNITFETHRALKQRATQHGRSTEAEIRSILAEAVRPTPEVDWVSELIEIGRQAGGVDLDIKRDQPPAGSTVEFG